MQLKKGQIVEIDIHGLVFGGKGIGKYEGLSVFVEGTMPGDKVKASFFRIKPKFAEAKLVEIIEGSKDRIKPKCPYFGICGGCQFQFMPYSSQLEFKKQHVIDCFERIGKIYNPPVEDVIGCKDDFYYRNKMEFSFGYDKDMNFALGMHVPGRKYDILDLKECHLQSKFSYKIINAIRDFAFKKLWSPYKYSCGEEFLRCVYIREGKRTGEVMVNLVGSREGFLADNKVDENLEDDFKEFAETLNRLDRGKIDKGESEKKIVSIYFSNVISKRGAPKQIKETLLYGKNAITEKMILENGDELKFDILPQAFFQVNTYQAEILYNQVIKMVGQKDHNVVFDLFCGTGTIGLFMAKHCKQIFGIELSEVAVRVARENANKNGIFNIDFYTGDVTKILKNLRERPSLIVLDPPRAGITEKTIKQINDFDANTLIYVSCNPSTLARDCNLLKGYGYQTKKIQPVDMFPHTYHIENVCLLER